MAKEKLWGGRFHEGTAASVEAYTQSISYDWALYKQDIAGSCAHARMLARQGVISAEEADQLVAGLAAVRAEIEDDTFQWKKELEDVHMNIESRLTELVGDVGKKLHTGRSRNDQVALDFRLFVSDRLREWQRLARELAAVYMARAEEHQDTILPGCTHLQPAQLTTVGKRATLWMYELTQDIENLEFQLERLRLLGSKGTTGTQASFMELFAGDEEKVRRLEQLIAEEMGFAACVPVSGQTYSRKVDAYFLSVLSGFAQSAYKFSNDMRLLQSFEEMEEPFEAHQIGSSAMPYKRNPMRSERISSLARYVIADSLNPAMTAGTQWFERTLDDSANKRISVSEAFLAVDAILNIYINITQGLVVYDRVVTRRVMEKLPFMATENIMMESVKRGGNRQELHEALRVHSHAAARRVKLEGGANDLIDRIAADPIFPLSREEIVSQLDPALYIGRSVSQVEEFLRGVARPILDRYNGGEIHAELSV